VHTNAEIPQSNQQVPDHLVTLPDRNDDEEGGMASKNHPDWEEDSIGNTPPSISKQNG
jgi:hypothetical protein